VPRPPAQISLVSIPRHRTSANPHIHLCGPRGRLTHPASPARTDGHQATPTSGSQVEPTNGAHLFGWAPNDELDLFEQRRQRRILAHLSWTSPPPASRLSLNQRSSVANRLSYDEQSATGEEVVMEIHRPGFIITLTRLPIIQRAD
jgi:hypothetical protein